MDYHVLPKGCYVGCQETEAEKQDNLWQIDSRFMPLPWW